MEKVKIEKLDFLEIDINKPLDWLQDFYRKDLAKNKLPLLQKEYLEHLEKTNTKDEELKQKIEQLKTDLDNDLLKEIDIDLENAKSEDVYPPFTKDQIKIAEYKINALEFHLRDNRQTHLKQFITQFEVETQNTAFKQKTQFYNWMYENFKNELKSIVKYLPYLKRPKIEYFHFLEAKKPKSQFNNIDDIINSVCEDINSNIIEFCKEIDLIKKIQYLEHLIFELENPSKITSKENYSLVPCEDAKELAEIIQENCQKLFESSFEQWNNLFSNKINIFSKPIKLKFGTTLQDLREFLDALLHNVKMFKNQNYLSVLEKVKAFKFKENIVSVQQLKRAKQGLKTITSPKNKNEINKIITALNNKLKDKPEKN